MNDHDTHDPDTKPVKGCPQCDEHVKRPIRRSHGAGGSTTVIPRPKPKP